MQRGAKQPEAARLQQGQVGREESEGEREHIPGRLAGLLSRQADVAPVTACGHEEVPDPGRYRAAIFCLPMLGSTA